MADVHTSEIRSYNMSRIRSTGTKVELKLAKALWTKGIRYRKNVKSIIGKPDFALKNIKLAIFCDNEFWHGKDIEKIEQRIGTNKNYWLVKIRRNIERDDKVNKILRSEGWIVLRYWEKNIMKNTFDVVAEIENIIQSLKAIR